MNILIIDDTSDDREQISRAVQHCSTNIFVECAESAETAMERLHDSSGEVFEVMLIDRYLPEMLGTDLAKKIRLEGVAREAALIMVTGDPGDAARADALANNFDGFMTKPVDPKRLKSMLVDKRIFWEISDLPNDLELYRSQLTAAS